MPHKFLDHGELAALARYLGEPADKIRAWRKRGKIEKFITNGRIDKETAAAEIHAMIAPRQRMSAEARWHKNRNIDHAHHAPETEAEITDYLNRTVGELSELPIYELQRFNELEKLLLARLKRQREDGELIPAEPVQRAAYDAGKKIKEQIASVADRCCSLVAAENDPFECKQILQKEINYVLEGLSKMLEVKT